MRLSTSNNIRVADEVWIAAAYAFAAVRRDRTIRPPDSIQLACASVAGVDMFITNDRRPDRKVVPGVHFIQSLATAAL